MSAKVTETSVIEVNGQAIEIETIVSEDFRAVGYAMKSEDPIEPVTVALTLYLMCKDVCGNCNIEIDDLADGLVESGTEH